MAPNVYLMLQVHGGWLTKQGGLLKVWRRRWFEIKGDILYYHKEQGVRIAR